MKVWEVISIITADGWYFARMKGSHRVFKHPVKPGHVVVAGRPGKDLATGTLINILKQASLR